MRQRLEGMESRYEAASAALADPSIFADQARYQQTAREHAELEGPVTKWRAYVQAER